MAELSPAEERFEVLRPALEAGIPLAQLARQQGLALRTARRWIQRYREHGLVGLVRAPRADRGKRRLAPDLQLLIEGLALRRPRPTAAFRSAGEQSGQCAGLGGARP